VELGSFDYRIVKQISVSLLFAVIGTALLTPPLMLVYRSRVSAWMARKADQAPVSPPQALYPHTALPPVDQLRRHSRSGVVARARAWFLGFAIQAALLSILFAARYADQLSVPAVLMSLGVFLVPAALVLVGVNIASGWSRLLVIGAIFLPLLLWPGLSGDLLRLIARLYVGIPLAPLLLFHLRFWRGAAPLVFLLALFAFNGWLLAQGLAQAVFGMEPGASLGIFRLAGLVSGLAVGLWVLRSVAERNSRGLLSDQALTLDSWWLLYTLVQAVVVSIGLGIAAGVLALMSFALGRWITGLALRGMEVPRSTPQRLLLLRVFGNSRRSERLLEQLVQTWSPLGPIELIGGVDLALHQVSPVDFLAFLTGRLGGRFGQAPSEAAARLVVHPSPAADGIYPVHQIFCHADTWEPTMRRLLDASDAVVMDLRQFRAERTGCRVELEALARSGNTGPLVLVTDTSTDHSLLRRVLVEAGGDRDDPHWHLVTATGSEATTVKRVMDSIGSS
jgi:hypothetical protein